VKHYPLNFDLQGAFWTVTRFTHFLKQLYEPVKESGRLSVLAWLEVSISAHESDSRDRNGLT
jgi:hypothetical protein